MDRQLSARLMQQARDVASRDILLVCNQDAMREVLQDALYESGEFNIEHVSNSKEAIRKLNERTYDCLIIEPELPDMDGWKLTRLIRSDILSIDGNVPVVIYSKTYSHRIAEAAAREFEVNAFVSVDQTGELVNTVSKIIDNRKPLYRAKVLVVEDTEDTVNLIKRFLDERYEITVCEDGVSGINVFNTDSFDLVLLDVMLPGMSGHDVLKGIMKINPQQTVVIMTAHCTPDTASELMLAGATDFIGKPFRASQLRQVCDIALHRDDYLVSQKQIHNGIEDLKNSEGKYRQLVESLSDEHFVYIQSPEGEFTYISPSIENILGYEVEDFTANFMTYLTDNDKNAESMKFHRSCLLGESQPRFEMELRRKDGSLCQIEVMESPVFSDNKVTSVHGIAHDVTSRNERTNLLKTLSYATFEGIIVHDKGKIIEVNHTAEQIFDLGRYAMIGSDIRFLIADEYRETLLGFIQDENDGQIELSGVRPDGNRFPLLLRSKHIRLNGREVSVISVDDLTDKKQSDREKELFQKQLRQAQKMESIGHLTGGIAHDFNNILASIQGYTGLSQELYGDNETLSRYLSEISKASERARVLISQMLAFSRGGTSQPKPVELAPHIYDAIKMLRATIPSSIVIREDLPAGLPHALVDAVQFHQVIMNICINARDAIEEENGIIDISVEHNKARHGTCSSCHQFISGEFITVKIRDTGKGMSEAVLSNIFDPFYSTKPVDKGTGMGLSVVHGIVHDHKGHILVESKPGAGTEFLLMFPVSNEKYNEIETVEEKVSSKGRGTIMVVDDDNDLAGFLKEMLTQRGYGVELFVDPCKALGAFEEEPNRYDLVLTDQTMPILPGHKLAQAMLKKRPDLPIILCTGYSDVMDEVKTRDMNISAYMQKPVESNQLVKVINTLIVSDSPDSAGSASTFH